MDKKQCEQNIWIVKQAGNLQGVGIKVLSDYNQI